MLKKIAKKRQLNFKGNKGVAEQLGKLSPKVSPLPYIIVPTTKGTIKFLIDCGANVNLISSKWANNSGKTIHNITTETVTTERNRER